MGILYQYPMRFMNKLPLGTVFFSLRISKLQPIRTIFLMDTWRVVDHLVSHVSFKMNQFAHLVQASDYLVESQR